MTCPSWCVNGTDAHPCGGDHAGEMQYEPATAGEPELIDCTSGALYTTVGAGARHCEMDGQVDPAVVIHISGWSKDVDVDLRPHEARKVAENILSTLALLEREAAL